MTGQKYADIIVACLKCLDKDSNAFGKEEDFEDDAGIKVGERYIAKVLQQLQDLRV